MRRGSKDPAYVRPRANAVNARARSNVRTSDGRPFRRQIVTACHGPVEPSPRPASMPELVFFYGTLMTPFHRPGRQRIEPHLAFAGRGSIGAALFDLGIYPAAVPATDGRVWGELYEILQPSV